MSALTDELRQHALMTANRMKVDAEKGEESVQKAYERVKSFEGVICPVCWVKDECKSELVTEAKASEANAYKCAKCGFNSVLPKP